jgi:hypothetical protein
VQWIYPQKRDIGGWIISWLPVSGGGQASGAPYPDPGIRHVVINTGGFLPQFRPQPGQVWRICIEPIKKMVDAQGNYIPEPELQGCAPDITWQATF